jgi:hypothetical protein
VEVEVQHLPFLQQHPKDLGVQVVVVLATPQQMELRERQI